MDRRRSRSLVALAVAALAALSVVSNEAEAAPKDAAAQKLQSDAMNNDYLGTNFAGAEGKLQKALKACGDAGCSPAVVAKIQRDLGVVYIGGLNKPGDGKAAFAAAFKADPNVALDKDLTTPDIQKAWDEVKKKGAKAEEPEEEEEEPKPKPKPKKKKPTVEEGDLIHTPPAEQAVLTPVPLFVELPEDVEAVKVQVRYKPFGTTEWKTLDLKKLGGGFGGEIPCVDIGDTTGDLAYYVQAVDAGGDVVGTSGTKAQPNKVPIRHELKGEPPHLPNKQPPAQCENSSNCPPGLPGCATGKKQKRGAKSWGASCDESKECAEGLECKNGQCETAEAGASGGGTSEEPAKACESSADCDGGACVDGKCASGGKKNWISFGVQQDLAMIGGNDVCSYNSQSKSGYVCFRGDGQQYFGSPTPGAADAIAGGIAPATTRLLVGADRFLTHNLAIGVRAGFAFRGGPAADKLNDDYSVSLGAGAKFLPLHLELRGSWWFGHDPTAKLGFRPYAFVGGGMAQVDAKVSVQVRELDPASNGDCPGGSYDANNDVVTDGCTRQDNRSAQQLDAWKRMGQGFAEGGGGVLYAVTRSSGVIGELKLMVMFPTSGVVIAPNVGYAIGF